MSASRRKFISALLAATWLAVGVSPAAANSLRMRRSTGAGPPAPNPGTTITNQIAYQDTTWNFNMPTLVGYYVNGEPWALYTPGLALVSCLPACTTVSGTTTGSGGGAYVGRKINGLMINPGNRSFAPGGLVANNSGYENQGYDSLVLSTNVPYTDSYNKDPANIGGNLPLTAATYVKTISVHPSNGLTDAAATGRGMINTLVPLTVVLAQPYADAFRPPAAVASTVSTWRESQIDYTKLRNYPKPAAVAGQTIADYYNNVIKYMGMTQNTNNTGSRSIQPLIAGNTYGRDLGYNEGSAALMIHTVGSNAEKRNVTVALLQRGIDVSGRIDEGGEWASIGGGSNRHKIMLLMVAVLLGDTHAAAQADGTANPTTFCEDGQLAAVDSSWLTTYSNFDASTSFGNIDTSLALYNGGTGYTVGDLLTLSGGDVRVPASIRVDQVDGLGKILGNASGPGAASVPSKFTLMNPSQFGEPDAGFFNFPPSPMSVTGGTGTGATFYYGRFKNNYHRWMLGMPEWIEHIRYDTRGTGGGQPWAQAWNYSAYYRQIVGTYTMTFALVAKFLTGGEAIWNNPVFFNYYDRFWNIFKTYHRGSTNEILPQAAQLWISNRGAKYSTAPALQSITAEGQYVWLTYDQMMDENTTTGSTWFPQTTIGTPAPADFTVTVNGSARAIAAVYHVIGYACALTLAGAPTVAGDVVVVSYTPATNRLRNIDLINAPSVSAVTATNIN